MSSDRCLHRVTTAPARYRVLACPRKALPPSQAPHLTDGPRRAFRRRESLRPFWAVRAMDPTGVLFGAHPLSLHIPSVRLAHRRRSPQGFLFIPLWGRITSGGAILLLVDNRVTDGLVGRTLMREQASGNLLESLNPSPSWGRRECRSGPGFLIPLPSPT